MSIQVSSYAFKSTPGPVLKVNEDLVDINLANRIFILMDGFGGAGIGDAAVKKVKDDIYEFYNGANLDRDRTLPFYYDPQYLPELNILVNGIYFSHQKFIKENMSKEISVRAGLSFIVALQVDSLLMLVSVGNCSAWLLRGNEYVTVVTPETINKVTGKISNNAACLYPSKAFGLNEKLHFSIGEIKAEFGDQLIMCTDGIYAYQTPIEMKYILSKSHLTNAQKVQEMIDLANARGNWDNQSLVLLNF